MPAVVNAFNEAALSRASHCR